MYVYINTYSASSDLLRLEQGRDGLVQPPRDGRQAEMGAEHLADVVEGVALCVCVCVVVVVVVVVVGTNTRNVMMVGLGIDGWNRDGCRRVCVWGGRDTNTRIR